MHSVGATLGNHIISSWTFAMGLELSLRQWCLGQLSLQCLHLAFLCPFVLFVRLILSSNLRGKGSGLLVHNKRLESRQWFYLEHMLFERGPARKSLVAPTHLHVLHLRNHIPLNGAEIRKIAMMKPQCVFIKNLLESETSFPIPFAPSTKFLANSIKKSPWDQCGCTLNSLSRIWAQFLPG